jgi:hypothetical protein
MFTDRNKGYARATTEPRITAPQLARERLAQHNADLRASQNADDIRDYHQSRLESRSLTTPHVNSLLGIYRLSRHFGNGQQQTICWTFAHIPLSGIELFL